jgi:hypothetical protein
MQLPQSVADRITSGLNRFQPILRAARARDVDKSETAVIVTDLLQSVFGFDKHAEIRSEQAISGRYCDLAIKLEGKLALLVAVNAIGLSLKAKHVKQAVGVAVNRGCDWVAVTNGILWQCFHITAARPSAHDLVLELNLLELSATKQADVERIWLLAREGIQKAGLADYHTQREALSRFTLAAELISDTILDMARFELRRISPDALIEAAGLCAVLAGEVIRRDTVSGSSIETFIPPSEASLA